MEPIWSEQEEEEYEAARRAAIAFAEEEGEELSDPVEIAKRAFALLDRRVAGDA